MSDSQKFDLIVIGGGPGGYVGAIRASQLGQKVAVIEKENLGGVCLNWGCIPTKALLRAAELKNNINHLSDFGIEIEGAVKINLEKVVSRSRDVASRLSGGVAHLMKKNKVTVFEGVAKIAKKTSGGWQIAFSGKKAATLEALNVMVATGARARQIPGMEADGDKIVTYRDAMVPKTMPKSLMVVGSGAIGMEFASFYSDMGVDVTVVEAMDRILTAEDKEIADIAHKSFEKRGIKIITSAKLESIKKSTKDVSAVISIKGKKQNITCERVIMAVGIIGNTEDIGLETIGVKIERGHIVTDGFGATNVDGIYAIGDVTGPPWLAHKASHEAIICVEAITKQKDVHPIADNTVPGCTYCRPQIASVGLTEENAKAAGYSVKIGRFPLLANGKAIAMGEDEGMVKTIFCEKTGALLGAHLIGAEVTEMIQGFAIARSLETTEAELMHTIFPHPTISEAMHESVLDAFDRAIHF
ncbi:dihydrolipoyl dehydrogenase [Alphaproteobacteria bacterium]|nr:dihydrolipoyl dehydrogenase [Alphaproteobacteria bacterium]